MVASSYPTGLDSLAKPASSTLENATGFEHDVVHTKAAEAVEAVQSTLGTNPQGSSATVKARLDTLATDVAGKSSAATTGNLLTTNQASVETDASGWTVSNATVARVVPQLGDGAWCLELTRGSTAANGTALSNPRPAVIPGQTYTASARIYGITNAGAIGLYFYNSANNGVGQIISSSVTAGVTARRTISMVAPSTAVTAGLVLITATTAGASRFDNMGVWAGAGGDWALPGVPITGTSPTEAQSLTGTGFPEGVVTAPVGSMYTDTAATNGAIRWIKATGSGNTGWRVEFGDTGWRNIESVLLNGFTATNVKIRRFGDQVSITIFALNGASSTDTTLYTLPTGFRSDSRIRPAWINRTSSEETPTTAVTYFSATVGIFASRTLITSGRGTIDYLTTDAWPATLPGTAA